MMKAVAALALFESVSAFQAPLAAKSVRAAPQMFSEGDIGVLPPLGVYDPLGLIETRDMRRYEIMEIKHGAQCHCARFLLASECPERAMSVSCCARFALITRRPLPLPQLRLVAAARRPRGHARLPPRDRRRGGREDPDR